MAKKTKNKETRQQKKNQANKNCQQGIVCYQKGEYHKAIKHLKKALKVKPDYSDAHYWLAATYTETGEFDEAYKSYKKIIELRTKDASVYVEFGKICGELQQYNEAFEAFSEALKLDQKNTDAYWGLGLTHFNLGQYDEAIKAMKKTVEYEPEYVGAYLHLGDIYRHLGEYEEAVEPFKKVTELVPKFTDGYLHLADIYKSLKRYDEAIETLKTPIELEPKDAVAYLLLGDIYMALERYEMAIKEYKQVVHLKPDYTFVHHDLGCCYLKTSDYVKAAHNFEKAIELNNKDSMTYYGLGRSYELQENYKDAIKAYEKGIELEPDGAYIYYVLGTCYNKTRNYNKAIHTFKRYIDLESRNAVAYQLLGYAYYRLEKYEQALNAFEIGISINPESPDPYILQGIMQYYIKQYDRAANSFLIAKQKFLFEKDNENAIISNGLYRYVTGIVNWANKSFEQAISDFSKAHQLMDPEDWEEFSILSKFFVEMIPFDILFEKLFLSSTSLDNLSTGLNQLSNDMIKLLDDCRKPDLYAIFPPIEAKSLCISALKIALAKQKPSSKSLDKARAILRDYGFLKGKRSVDAIENFAYDYIKICNKNKGKLSEQEERMLLKELKPVADLNGMLSREVTSRQIREMIQELGSIPRILDALDEKFNRIDVKRHATFNTLSELTKSSALFLQTEGAYEVYIKGKKKILPASYVDEYIRTDENKERYDLWIDMEKREVIINNDSIDPGDKTYKLMIYIAQSVGKFRTRKEIFKAVWGLDKKNNDPHFTNNLQQMFHRYIYDYGSGLLKKHMKGKKGGYDFKSTLNSCLICKNQ
jgi:superkiller protein 3